MRFEFCFHREIQTIVLKSIASIADKHKQIFEPYLKSFYVHSNDSGLVKHYKLEILTILANASNISTILREFQVSEILISIVNIISLSRRMSFIQIKNSVLKQFMPLVDVQVPYPM
jgi:vesicle coat complex subunit